MNNMTNRWIGVMMALVFAGMVTSARGGSLDAPAGPMDPASAMWTLKDIYDVLNTRTTNVAKRTSFKEPTAGPTSGTMHNLNDIMTLVTNRAPAPKTGQTTSYAVGDDGTNRIGVAWPNPRFTIGTGTVVNTTNCVLDNLTGLMWTRNANLASNATFNSTWWSSVMGTCGWYQAFDVVTNSAGPVNGANYGGYSDWRLPNVRELLSLVDYGRRSPALCNTTGTGQWTENNPFKGVRWDTAHWSSTGGNSTPQLEVGMDYGAVYGHYKTNYSNNYVWAVRGGR